MQAKGLKVEFSGKKSEDTYDRTGGNVKEGVIYEKQEEGEKKIDVMKGKNKVNVNPTIGEQIKAELTAISQKKIDEANAAAAEQAAALAAKAEEKATDAKIKALKKQKQAMREECDTCEECGKSPCKCEKKEGEVKAMDPREIPTRINLAKNKLRSMGLKMSYDMEGELVDERTRYAKETGKDPQTGKPSVKGGNPPPAAMKAVEKELRSTGGLMSSRRKPIQPQGKKKVPGAKGPKGVTPVDKIKGKLAQKRAPKPDIGSRFD